MDRCVLVTFKYIMGSGGSRVLEGAVGGVVRLGHDVAPLRVVLPQDRDRVDVRSERLDAVPALVYAHVESALLLELRRESRHPSVPVCSLTYGESHSFAHMVSRTLSLTW